jgi:hypothetical protein
MVNVFFYPPQGFEPAARVLNSAGGPFVAFEIDANATVYAPGDGAASAAYARQLSAALAKAADEIELSVAMQQAAARRDANTYAEAQAEQAFEAMLGRAV